MEIFGGYKETIEFLFGGVGVTLIGLLGIFVKKLKLKVNQLTTAVEEEKAVSPGAAIAMVYYDKYVQIIAHRLTTCSIVTKEGETIDDELDMTFIIWMPDDIPLEPDLMRRYAQDMVSNRHDVTKATIESDSGLDYTVYVKRKDKKIMLFDSPSTLIFWLSYFSRVINTAGFPENMPDSRKTELHLREREAFISTLKNLVQADGFTDKVQISSEPIAFV